MILRKIKSITSILSSAQKKKLACFQVFIIFSALIELVAVSTLPTFLYIASTKNVVETDEKVRYFFNYLNLQSHYELIQYAAFIALTLIISGNVASLCITYFLTKFSAEIGHELSSILFKHYLKKPYLFHVQNSSSKLINNIYSEVGRIFSGIFNPILQLNAKLILSIALVVNLFFNSPDVTLIMISVLGFIYVCIYLMVKNLLSKNGKVLTDSNITSYNTLNESLSGIKEIKQMQIEDFYHKKFFDSSIKRARAIANNQLISMFPKNILEIFAFGGGITFIIHLISGNKSFEEALPTLSLFAISGYKLMPAIQQVFSSISSAKSNINAFHNIKKDLQQAQATNSVGWEKSDTKIDFKNNIQLKEITFSYPNNNSPVLNDLTFDISKNESIALVGLSGSGKTTTVDVLLGILHQQIGSLYIDGKKITNQNISSFMNIMGYVPQTIFLSDSTLAENIALGENKEDIDIDRVIKALRMADLYDHVMTLEETIFTKVGERGVQLSGGQRQRVGIARVLYRSPEIIIFDEATSALDSLTEHNIMNSIDSLKDNKTILIIAHRLTTIQNCDKVLIFEKGQIVDSGTYDELITKNSLFQKMANNRFENIAKDN